MLLLGAAGFAAGLFGPMIFTPEANQGPLVGIFISGPAGAALGLVLLVVFSALNVSARAQWRALMWTAVGCVLAVLILIQPGPALRGYVMDLEIESCSRPAEIEQPTIAGWVRRIAEVTWSPPSAGWETSMRETIRAASGVLVEVQVREQISVWERRKPWNRGSVFATSGRSAPEEHSFYAASGSCEDYPAGRTLKVFEAYDLNGQIKPPDEWPPRAIEQIMNVSPIVAVPARFEHLSPH